MEWIFHAALRALGYLILFCIICFVYGYARRQSKITKLPMWLQYGHAIFWSAVIALFAYSANDGTVEECADADPMFGGGDCYITEEYYVDEEDRKEKAGAIFIFLVAISSLAIKDREKSQGMLSNLESNG